MGKMKELFMKVRESEQNNNDDYFELIPEEEIERLENEREANRDYFEEANRINEADRFYRIDDDDFLWFPNIII